LPTSWKRSAQIHSGSRLYRHAAAGVRRLPKPLAEIWREQGDEGLRGLTGVGERLATALRTLVTTGRLPMLDRLRGETDPVALLESVPGIGRVLAERLHCEFGIDSLEDLEAAANDGRLSDLAGIGKKKLGGITDTLATRLGHVRRPGFTYKTDEPSVEELMPALAPLRGPALFKLQRPVVDWHIKRIAGNGSYLCPTTGSTSRYELDRVASQPFRMALPHPMKTPSHKPCKRRPPPWQLLSTGDPRPPDVALGCTPS
jgi:helix-hairpin-helix protein